MELLIAFGSCYIRAVTALSLVPYVRSMLGIVGIGAVSFVLTFSSIPFLLETSGLHAIGERATIVTVTALVCGEVLLGGLVALPFLILAQLLPMAARMVDYFRGTQFGEQMSPGSVQPETALEQLAVLFVLLFLTSVDAYQWIVASWLQSFALAPGVGLALLAGVDVQQVALQATKFFTWVLVTSFLLALPVAALSVCFDVVGAWTSRFVPRMNAVFELLPLKAVFGLLAVAYIFNDISGLTGELLPTKYLEGSFLKLQK